MKNLAVWWICSQAFRGCLWLSHILCMKTGGYPEPECNILLLQRSNRLSDYVSCHWDQACQFSVFVFQPCAASLIFSKYFHVSLYMSFTLSSRATVDMTLLRTGLSGSGKSTISAQGLRSTETEVFLHSEQKAFGAIFCIMILCLEMFRQLRATFFVSHWCRSLVFVWYTFALYALFASAARE